MNSNEYKVLITTSGTGSRLGVLTENTNKALVLISGKVTIDYLISRYPPDVAFVITIGYLGDKVRDFLISNYPERKFEFVKVDKYEGSGSSLGYSMLSAKEKLQCPFIFQVCDTIVVEKIPVPEKNWIGGFVVAKDNTDLQLDQYRTHKVSGGEVIKINDKGILDFDSIHIGLVGINDYKGFWKTLEELYKSNPGNSRLSDVHVEDRMLQNGSHFEWLPFSIWLDTGTLEAVKKASEYFSKHSKKK